jgi:predicted AlkP superfamily phosphohydrolase/phosphomutase
MPILPPQLETTRRIVVIGIGGLSWEVVTKLAAQGVMPKVAGILPRMARANIEQPFFSSPNAAWKTWETGTGNVTHGLLDDLLLDPTRRCLRRASQESTDLEIVFQRKPADWRELENGVARTIEILQKQFAEARERHVSVKPSLVMLKLTVFDSLFLRLWHLLGVSETPGGRRSWIAETQKVFRELDEQLNIFFDLVTKDDSACVLMSPYGFVPFREKIILNELLRRKGLLHMAAGRTRFRYECLRFLAKQKKHLGLENKKELRLDALLPIDWRRTRAVSLHGENAALVYLNTPERFGRGPIKTHQQQKETLAEVIAALTEARHPLSGEPLFQSVFSTSERLGSDPLEKRWPEVIGIPTPGYQVRQRFDRARQLVRPDASLSGARTGEGFMCWFVAGDKGEHST